MHVVLVYDIDMSDEAEGQRRLNNIRKVCRKYLNHVQYSVFEGNLSEGKLAKLEQEITLVIDKSRDSVIIYTIPDGVNIQRKILTNSRDPSSNII